MSTLQILMYWSWLAEARIYWLLGLNAKQAIFAVCALKLAISQYLLRSQSLILVSSPAEARYLEFCVTEIVNALSVCPCRVFFRGSACEARFQIFTLLSALDDISVCGSDGQNCTDLIMSSQS